MNAIEIVCEAKGWPSLGYRIAGWAKGNPWFVGLIVLALGTFLAHFFLNGLPSAG